MTTGINDEIKLFDVYEGLELFCYKNCCNGSSLTVKNSRGVIYKDNNVVLQTFPYSDEYTTDILPDTLNFNDCVIYESHEGSVIRMFYCNDKWYISTHKKISAFNSRWSSNESYGDMFKKSIEYLYNNDTSFKERLDVYEDVDILEKFKHILDISKQYVFFILNTSHNRIVCIEPEHPTVYHTGTFHNSILSLEDNIGISYPKKFTFTNLDELRGYVDTIDHFKLQGVICFFSNNVQIKVYNRDYLYYFDIRSNEYAIGYRYLQLRNDANKVLSIMNLYPDYINLFKKYETTIQKLSVDIHKSYINRYIQKNYVILPKEQHRIIKECHQLYISKTIKFVSIEDVYNVLSNQKPIILKFILKKYMDVPSQYHK